MNDPNGLYYKDGVYHLFFQHYPDGNKWGPMHWGHATSKDLVKWEEHPIALYPDDLGYIFSGSAVVDKNNTSGFGDSKNNPVVAVYTYHNPNREKDGKIDVESQELLTLWIIAKLGQNIVQILFLKTGNP
jgi:levanase/fructan beta-fructosidase